jgi:hypothetical protein
MVWVSRQGAEQPISDALFCVTRIPSRRMAGARRHADGNLWIQDIERATFTRLTRNSGLRQLSGSVDVPDGSASCSGTRRPPLDDADGGGRPQSIAGSTSLADIPGQARQTAKRRLAWQNADRLGMYVLNLRGDSKPRALLNAGIGRRSSPLGRTLDGHGPG